MKIYITDKALTRGIITAEAKPVDDNYYHISEEERKRIGLSYGVFKIGLSAFASKKQAVKRATELRDSKILSLENQIMRLKDMVFWEDEIK